MNVPISWLNEFIETGLSPEELATALTMAGLEAEKIEQIGTLWDNVYVGRVLKVSRHPDADRLVLAEVEAGEHRLTVVTGAPNVAEGQRVALALAGARLYDGHSDSPELKTLKPGMIRGVKSEGMVCSEKELGLSDEHEGIIVFPDDAPVGAPLKSYLGDTVIEFEITPNLAHAFSIHGIAREASAITKKPIRVPTGLDAARFPKVQPNLVSIEDARLSPRYMAIVFEDVTIGPSPEWLSRRLAAAGMRSINNIVDATNFVMHELGQPLHAFDRDTLREGRIVVRPARAGETIETLDHQIRHLKPEMLVIADAERPVAVAGVMGGFETEVNDSTTTILLEGANFDQLSVRHTSKALKLRSDASARYERGVDPNLVGRAMSRAAELILELLPGSRIVDSSDVYPVPTEPRTLNFPLARIEQLLGVAYPEAEILDVLGRLEFQPTIADGQLFVTIPTYRRDVSIAEDIIEEVARIIGYQSLPSTLPTGSSTEVRRDPMFQLRRDVRDILQAAGAFEAISYVTVSRQQLEPYATDGSTGFVRTSPIDELVKLKNPLQADRDVLRPTILPTLLESLAENLKHETTVRLDEMGRIYLPEPGNALPQEIEIAAIAMAGARHELAVGASRDEIDFSDIKGVLDVVFERLVLKPTVERAIHPALHPGRAARWMVGDRQIALAGELHPALAGSLGIEGTRVAVAEIDLTAILGLPDAGRRPVSVPRYLPVQQDFAVVVDEATPAIAVQQTLLDAGRPLATDIAMFDIYRGVQIGEGKKSLAYRMTFLAPDRALTDGELLKVRGKIEKSLKQRVSGTLRA